MNLRDLKYVLAVAETRHFGQAAERCFVSQPTLSGQIKKLEDELGVKIFERSNRSVAVTEFGKSMLINARQLVEQADVIEQLARAHQDPLAGPLRIGIIPTLSPYLMPWVLGPLKHTYPQIKLVLYEELTDVLLKRLDRHEIDAALLATNLDETGFRSLALFNEPFWLAHPNNHVLATKSEIEADDLHNSDLLLLAEGHCLARQVMGVCQIKARGAQSDMADLRAASLETLLQLVAAGFGTTLVPALAARLARTTQNLVLRPLAVPGAYRQISLIHRSTFPRQPALLAVANLICEQLPSDIEVTRVLD